MSVVRTVPLRFAAHAVDARTHVNLSAVRSDGECLWIGGDETATVERFTATADGYADHTTVALDDLVDLPGGPAAEVDVEGLARRGSYLWAVGSHSRRRRRIKDHHGADKALRRLAKVTAEPAREVLVRLAVEDGPDGLPVPVRETADGHRSALLGRPGLLDALADDPRLAPFLAIPGKDNGFDVEGLAVLGDPGEELLYLGLRGPVLRGWAVVLEVRPRETHPGRLDLAPFDDGALYRTHLLDLGGLGVRDLCPDGDDLLVLAGPSMSLDGPVRVHRWHGTGGGDAPVLGRPPQLTRELDLPHGAGADEGADHAEGIALVGEAELLVVYDSPAPARLVEHDTVLADVVALPRRSAAG